LRLISFITFSIFVCHFSNGQNSNILLAEPDELRTFLGTNFKKIEIEINSLIINPSPNAKPVKPAIRIIQFKGDTSCIVININKSSEADTMYYRYDKCGKLLLKKGQGTHFVYSNRYKNCKLISREIKETEVDNSGASHQWNLVKYVYDKAGKLQKELISDFEDSLITKYSNEYMYLGNFKDTVKEYYFDEDGNKLLNRLTKYNFSTHLNAIEFYSLDRTLIDKTEFIYNPNGKIERIKEGTRANYLYTYSPNNSLVSVTDETDRRENSIKSLE